MFSAGVAPALSFFAGATSQTELFFPKFRGMTAAVSSFSFSAILHGGDYNPEQWPEEVWDEDVELMRMAHVNVATLPVFGWARLQPEEDVFDFAWLDRVIGRLHAGGVGICLATATASVPAWVDRKYPEVLRVGADGLRVSHGMRHSFCPNSPVFRRLSTGLARKLAERYAEHPAVLMWHISNEYMGNASPTCHCEYCTKAFREWLQARYGTIEELNLRWNSDFWSQRVTDWEQIDTPLTTGNCVLAQRLDFARFASRSYLNCYCAERDAVREYNPKLPVTTNLMGSFKPADYHEWAKEMDFVCLDSYPQRHTPASDVAFQLSLTRGLKEGLPWLLMEQTPSQTNWTAYNALKRPGVMRLLSYQAVAHGSEAVMYFQWRRSRGGMEKFHGAVVEHAGSAEARVFREVAQLGGELEKLGTRTLGGRVESPAAVLFDWENWWAVEFSMGPSADMKYVPRCGAHFSALHTVGYATDVVSPEADLSRYKLVVAPVLYMVKPGVAERLEAFVASGGTLLVTYFSGIVDETDMVFEGGYPGPLRKVLGIRVEELDVLEPTDANTVVFQGPLAGLGTQACGHICERVHLESAAGLAEFGEDFYAGEPALTVNSFGLGKAYYLATELKPEGLREVLKAIAEGAGVMPPFGCSVPEGVEVMKRCVEPGAGSLEPGEIFYVLNHNAKEATVPLPKGKFVDLLTDRSEEKEVVLGAKGVAILRRAD